MREQLILQNPSSETCEIVERFLIDSDKLAFLSIPSLGRRESGVERSCLVLGSGGESCFVQKAMQELRALASLACRASRKPSKSFKSGTSVLREKALFGEIAEKD